ncbi:hypothetical protein LZ554_008242 [Drepanopeziza brunnea f. sp. 'monogermtubi']|nr:hypothetical protein LZ554_008242 [Drepanopeziza brunnea f. sp. 'monogermtubi']
MELPNLRRAPSYHTILKALKDLQINPATWDDASLAEVDKSAHDASVNSFLMSVITSELDWLTGIKTDAGRNLPADGQKEVLIQEASKRVAERCGRSAAGEMTRTWVIPESLEKPEIGLDLREPPLTGDMLGLKTWGTSYVISKKLEYIGNEFLSELVTKSEGGPRVLELGAGTGLVGMAAAAIWSTSVVLTDLEEIQENLLFNIEKNQETIESMGGHISGAVLDWTKPNEALSVLPSKEFEIIIAADPMYDREHPGLVAQMVSMFLKKGTQSRVLTAIPLRDDHTKRMAFGFTEIMVSNGFCVIHQELENFKDDWQDRDAVKVQWTIWRRVDSSGTVNKQLT